MINKNKGITLVALIITVIILLILAGIVINLTIGNDGIITKAQNSGKTYELSSIKEQIQMEILGRIDNNLGVSENDIREILDKYGKVVDKDGKPAGVNPDKYPDDTIWLEEIWGGNTVPGVKLQADGSFDGTVNSPKILGNMKPVYWNGSSWEKPSSNKQWYDYNSQQWANAMTDDGSLWVWIPRYEYQITGKTINVNFLKNKEQQKTSGYRLHPSFGIDTENGGWANELEGFWVAKYAAGFEDIGSEKQTTLPYTTVEYPLNIYGNITVNSTKMTYPVFKAEKPAYNLISGGDAYLLAKEIKTANNIYGLAGADSHLIKNSEWGAVAYLTQSMYGRDGVEVTTNSKNENNTINNIYGITSYGNSNTPNDISASSTNNMSGVFDLNGCVWERTAGFFRGGTVSNSTWHDAMANSSTSSSSEYVTLYTADNKYGDAINETTGWNGDYAYFTPSGYPLFIRRW